MDDPAHRPSGFAVKAGAWAVHGFTASGTVLALLALMAIMAERWALALFWLLVALVVDGVDGSLARVAHVKTRAPRIDGDTMDLVIDYLNYVFVPAVLIWRAGLVPAGAAPYLAALILVSALYNFTRRDLKTADNYFRGFPALWNVVAFYFFLGRPGGVTATVIILCLAALTFAPVHFIHPFRVRDYGRWPPILAALWALATAALIRPGWSEGVRGVLLAASLSLAGILFVLGILRTFRGPKPAGGSS
jgi:phosphatidylcholine synthase